MIKYSVQYTVFAAGLAALTACAPPMANAGGQTAGAMGDDLGSSARAPARVVLAAATPRAPAHVLDAVTEVHDAHADMPATGVVNTVDMERRKVNISHEAIPAISWPSMTMDFPVAASVDLRVIKPGVRVNFRIHKGAGDMYEVTSIRPAGGR